MLASTRGRRAAVATASLLALTAGIACASQAEAQAKPAAATEEKATTIDEVVVVGTRASLQSAMNRKKRNGTISDSIVAEDIGQFPDKNIGEALGRVTGVQLARDFGEGNAVSIRGVEPDLNRVEINGMSTLSTGGNLSVYGGGGQLGGGCVLGGANVAARLQGPDDLGGAGVFGRGKA